MIRNAIACALLVVTVAPAAWSQTRTEYEPPWDSRGSGEVEIFAEMQNLLLYRSDTDFDGSEPLWDKDGQSSGVFASVFRPMFSYPIFDSLRLHYEAEMGLNYWSRNNPDQEDMTSPSVFVMKHRELYASGEADIAGFKLGYGRFIDPTGLFLNHWIGAAQFWVGEDETRLGLFVGQVPEDSHEGIDVTENNFARDIFVYGARFDLRIDHGWFMAVGLHNLYDSHLPGQERWLLCPNVHLEAGEDELVMELDAMLQVGQAEGQTPDGRIQQLLGWAAQGHLRWDITERFKLWPSVVEVNLLALSPDDAHPDNDKQHAFWASGKNRSATIMLTEDEIRDWYDNFDERMGTLQGGFFNMRAGLFIADIDATWRVAATVLKPQNALDETFAGFEFDLISEFFLDPSVLIHLAFGGLVPGPAGSAMLNTIDAGATDPLWMCEISVLFRY